MARPGFSSANPITDTSGGGRKTASNPSGSRGGGGASSRPSPPSVSINGNTVTIGGQGFSVAPSQQAAFIQQRTGGSGSSAQAAIQKANNIEKIRKAEEIRKQGELNKLNNLKVDIARSRMAEAEKKRWNKQIEEQKNVVNFQSKLRTGEIQGFSGTGLTREQMNRRDSLIKLGVAKEMSSKDTKGLFVDPVKTSFFLSTVPTESEKQDFQEYMKQLKQDFTPPVIRDKTSVEKYLNKFKLVQGIKNTARNLNITIENYKKARGVSARQQLANQVNDNKRTFIQRLKKSGLISSKATARQAGMFALGFSSVIFNFAASLPRISGAVVAGTPGVVKATPSFIKKVVNDPKNSAKTGWKYSKVVGNSIKESGFAFGKLIMVEPGLALGQLTGELYVMKGIGKGVSGVGKGFRVTGKLTAKAAKPLKPLFRQVKIKRIAIIKRSATATKSMTKKTIRKIEGKSKTGAKIIKKVKDIRKRGKSAKIIREAEINKFKSRIQFKKQLDVARKARKIARKNGRTINIGNRDYIESLAFVEDIFDKLATAQARKIIGDFLRKGGKLTSSQKEEFIKAVKASFKKRLDNYPKLKELRKAAKFTEPYQIKLIKSKKLSTATNLVKNINSRIKKLSIIKQARKILDKIKNSPGGRDIKSAVKGFKKLRRLSKRNKAIELRKFREAVKKKGIIDKVKKSRMAELKQARAIRKIARAKKKARGVVRIRKIKEPSKLLKKIKGSRGGKDIRGAVKGFKKLRRLSKSAREREIARFSSKVEMAKNLKQAKRISSRALKAAAKKKAIRSKVKIRFIKQKNVRNVKLQDIDRVSNYRNVNKLVDNLFDEVNKRNRVNLNPAKYRALKNTVKKKLIKAARNNNIAEINKFKLSAKKILQDMNRPSAQPTVRIVKKGTRSYKTIKDFKPETPKGQYVEIKQGQQVMLQEVKQIQKPKLKQRFVEQKQIYVVETIQKQLIDFRSMVKFATSASGAIGAGGITKQKTRQARGSRSSQSFSPGFKTNQGSKLKSDVITKTSPGIKIDVAQIIATKQKKVPTLKTKQVNIQRKKKIIKSGTPKGFIKKKLTNSVPVYYVVEKVRGDFKKLYPRLLTAKDAKDYAVYSIDNRLSKTAFIVPVGISKDVMKAPKSIINYASRNARKVRPYKIRFGKRKQLVNGFIEKRKFFRDTPGENKQLKRLRKPLTLLQKKALVARLRKGRMKKRK